MCFESIGTAHRLLYTIWPHHAGTTPDEPGCAQRLARLVASASLQRRALSYRGRVASNSPAGPAGPPRECSVEAVSNVSDAMDVDWKGLQAKCLLDDSHVSLLVKQNRVAGHPTLLPGREAPGLADMISRFRTSGRD